MGGPTGHNAPPRLGQRLKASGYQNESPENGSIAGRNSASSSARARRLRLIGIGVGIAVLLGGCTGSPEAARVRGEPGADPGNHGNPVVLLAPPDRVERVYYEIPYDGPKAVSEDTSQS
jgi:hypothetical protein